MENYKKAVNKRIILLTIPTLIAVALGLYDVFLAPPEVKDSLIFGFQCGAATALGVLALFLIMRYRKLLRNEQLLKIEFNKENDERLKAIRAKAGMPMLLITSVVMIISGIIAGYFNTTVFKTLIITAMCQMLIGCFVKLIYTKKM